MKPMSYSQKQRISDKIVTGMGMDPSGAIGFLVSSVLADFPDFILFSLSKSFPVDRPPNRG